MRHLAHPTLNLAKTMGTQLTALLVAASLSLAPQTTVTHATQYRHHQPHALSLSPANAAAPLTDDQRLAAEAWRLTDREFVDRDFSGQDWFQTRQRMVRGTKYASRDAVYDEIRAMLKSLDDRYTRFLTPAMYSAVYSVATGSVAGIGVELQLDEGAPYVRVNSVVDDGPAFKAGLQAGDRVERVDGEDVGGISAEEVASQVRGPAGSKVALQLAARAPDSEPLKLVIERAEVKLAAVTSSGEMVGGKKVGLIKIRQFSTETAADVKAALEKQLKAQPSAIVVDLRGNTGGYFTGGIDVARLFLPKDKTITVVTDNRLNQVKYETYEDGLDTTTPLVVVVDERTASASEIFSSAVHDNGRAKLVGAPRTYGKAVIQTVSPLSDGSAVVVTTARYRTPLGTDINRKGIEVDQALDACTPSVPAPKCLVAGVL